MRAKIRRYDTQQVGHVDKPSTASPHALATAVRGGAKTSDYFDTGMKLVTGDPVRGVRAENVAYGVRICWGD